LSKDGKSIYFVIANGSWTRAVPCRVRLKHFPAETATAVALSSGDPDGKPLLDRKENFVSDFSAAISGNELSCAIPPHAVVFVTLKRHN
jgi:alpha-L-arabinofuranosidase